MQLKPYLFYLISLICSVLASRQWTDESFDVISIENTEYSGSEHFPDEIELNFRYYDNDERLVFKRDDETTKLLTGGIFRISNSLPEDIFEEKNKEHFAAYTSNGEDAVIVHREQSTAQPRFYGRYSSDGESYVIGSVDGSPVYHTVRKEVQDQETSYFARKRRRRSLPSQTDLVEVLLAADSSIYDFFNTTVHNGAKSKAELEADIKAFLKALSREVDMTFEKASRETGRDIRIVFHQYQVLTSPIQEPFIGSAVMGNLTDLARYYDRLVSKFGFPDVDHVMTLTKKTLIGGAKVFAENELCSSAERSVSLVSQDYFPTTAIQAIAKALGVPFDSDDSCVDSDHYIMSRDYGYGVPSASQASNRYTFSSCSLYALMTTTLNLGCLKTDDKKTDFNEFLASPRFAELYTLDEMCAHQQGYSSTFCNANSADIVDCYSDGQGCTLHSSCVKAYVPLLTRCNFRNSEIEGQCRFGVCFPSDTTSTSSTTTSTTSSASPTTTPPTHARFGSTSLPGCATEIQIEEVDLPGCGCCGGCGCDDTCEGCETGLPANKQGDFCVPEDNCCQKKVRFTTVFIPDDCNFEVEAGPQTLVYEKRGWEKTDVDVKAEVYKEDGDWQVRFANYN